MADITMCQDSKCPYKVRCYRFTAKPGFRQAIFAKSPYNKETETCEYFWNNKGIK